ncbi:hypothetical protein DFH07DRAFT_850249 [Mycena maculata]|uniref:Uncharacterized protein n=1 Tax=Mycena maculata TaxID=230809 RepID=A0AAD7HXB0_9AGAR|nr:hypothetical protein DFH07DRAFT_850249 [Mycena maculata]
MPQLFYYPFGVIKIVAASRPLAATFFFSSTGAATFFSSTCHNFFVKGVPQLFFFVFHNFVLFNWVTKDIQCSRSSQLTMEPLERWNGPELVSIRQ